MPHKGLFKVLNHGSYEQLCTKPFYTSISNAEFDELIVHVHGCVDCRAMFRDFIQIVAHELPHTAEAYDRTVLPPANTLERSATAAAAISRKNLNQPRLRRRWVALLASCAALLLCAIALTTYVGLEKRSRDSRIASPIVSPQNRAQADNNREREILDNVGTLKEQLNAAQLRIGELEAALKNAREAASTAEAKTTQLSARIEGYEATIADDHRVTRDQASAIEQLERQAAEKEKILTSKDAAYATLNGRLVENTERLNRQREDNAALSRLQALIAARDLHLVSVPPIEPHPDGSRAFGRILYAEGKEAMFYGYDLPESGELANVNFHVWGEKTGSVGSPRSLGVFTSDDKSDSRWRLTVSDASVLAKIDRIFVTIEPVSEVVTKPSGKKILIGYLGDKPNHP